MKLTQGILGWGNRKTGLEAYGAGGRWEGHQPHPEDGDLLGDALEREGNTEGDVLLIVSISRQEQIKYPTIVGDLKIGIQAVVDTINDGIE